MRGDEDDEYSIQELAKAAGTTSRTLRHYGAVGLLPPSRTGHNGYRYYDRQSLISLQRILLLRELGLGLPAIGEVLAGDRDPADALEVHLDLLQAERARVDRQIASIRTTLRKTRGGERLMATEAFDGFDHTQYEDEVTQRWGRDAYERGDRWWRSMSADEQKAFQQAHVDLAADWGTANAEGVTAETDRAQTLAARHVAWLSGPVQVSAEYVANIGAMYLADDRFGRNYERHGAGTTQLVADALAYYAGHSMSQ